MDFLRKDNTRFIEVVGSKGTIRIDLILGKIELFSITKNKWKVLYSDHSHLIDSYKNQFFNFFSYLFHSNSTINKRVTELSSYVISYNDINSFSIK